MRGIKIVLSFILICNIVSAEIYPVKSKNGVGFIDERGIIKIPLIYSKINEYSIDEKYIICSKNNLIVIYDSEGKKQGELKLKHTPEKWEITTMKYKDGYIRVLEKGKYGYINTNGKYKKYPIYEFASDFSENRAVVKLDGNWKLIDSEFNVIKEGKFSFPDTDNFYYEYRDGLMPVMDLDNEYYGYIDKLGNEIGNMNYDYAWNFCEKKAVVMKNEKYGYINQNGVEITDIIYDEAYNFKEEMALVKENGKYFYLDGNGNRAFNMQYDYGESFSEGVAVVIIEGKYRYIDKKGNIITKKGFEKAESFSEETALVKYKGKYGYINRSFDFIIPPIYDEAFSFEKKLAKVKKNKWYYIDKQGKKISDYIIK